MTNRDKDFVGSIPEITDAIAEQFGSGQVAARMRGHVITTLR